MPASTHIILRPHQHTHIIFSYLPSITSPFTSPFHASLSARDSTILWPHTLGDPFSPGVTDPYSQTEHFDPHGDHPTYSRSLISLTNPLNNGTSLLRLPSSPPLFPPSPLGLLASISTLTCSILLNRPQPRLAHCQDCKQGKTACPQDLAVLSLYNQPLSMENVPAYSAVVRGGIFDGI
jgi:hypothetical protein